MESAMPLVSLQRGAIVALLFDLDGTLVDSASANARAYAVALGEAGVAIEVAELRAKIGGRNWRQFLPEILEGKQSKASAKAIAERKTQLYPKMAAGVRLNEGLLALARTSRDRFQTALVTTASRQNTMAIVNQTGMDGLFDTIVTGDDVLRHKPDPEAYHLAASRLGIDPIQCIAFEDSLTGIESARAAGMHVVTVRME